MSFERYDVMRGDGLANLADAVKAMGRMVIQTRIDLFNVTFDTTEGRWKGEVLPWPKGESPKKDIPGALVLSGNSARRYSFFREGFGYFLYRLSMPEGYFADRVGHELAQPHIDHWSGVRGKREITLHLAYVERSNGELAIIACLTPVHAYISHPSVLEEIGNLPNHEVKNWVIDPTRMSADLVADVRDDTNVMKLANGDEVYLVMSVGNSETGWGKLRLRGEVHMATGPGWAILPKRAGYFEARHQGQSNILKANYEATWKSLTKAFKVLVQNLEQMADIDLDVVSLEGILQDIADALSLPVKARKWLETHVQAKGQYTVLDIWTGLNELAAQPDYQKFAERIQEASGTWVVETSKSPLDCGGGLWVTL